MKHFLTTAILKLLIFFALGFAGAALSMVGGEVPNGGDVVQCSASAENAFTGYYTVDYLLTFNTQDPVIEVDSSEQALNRISTLLKSKYPDLSRKFSEFQYGMENHNDFLKPRIWQEAKFGLETADLQGMVRKIPNNCLAATPDRKPALIRSVTRLQRSNIVIYEYDPNILTWLRKNRPLQYSFLMVHEWLWDLTSDPANVRRVNRFLHSQQAHTLNSSSFKQVLINMGLDLTSPEYRSVCQRASGIRNALEEVFRMSCSEIDRVQETQHKLPLVRLNSSSQSLTTIEPADLSGMGAVTEFDVSHNQIAAFFDGNFKPMASLRYMNAANNNLTHIGRNVFQSLNSLTWINLSSNQISSIESGAFDFAKMSSFTAIILTDNKLSGFPADIFSPLAPKCLTENWVGGLELNLNFNKISNIPQDFWGLVPASLGARKCNVGISLKGNPLTATDRNRWCQASAPFRMMCD